MRCEQMSVNAGLFESIRVLVPWAAQCTSEGASALQWQYVNMAWYNIRLLWSSHYAQLDNAFYVPVSHANFYFACALMQ